MQANMECLTPPLAAVPAEARWGVTHYGRDNWDFLAAANIAMGASVVRIDWRTVIILRPVLPPPGIMKKWEKLAALIRAMDLEVASPVQASGNPAYFPKGKR